MLRWNLPESKFINSPPLCPYTKQGRYPSLSAHISLYDSVPIIQVIQVFNFSFNFFPPCALCTLHLVSKPCHFHQNMSYRNYFLLEKFIYINIWFITSQLTRPLTIYVMNYCCLVTNLYCMNRMQIDCTCSVTTQLRKKQS